MSSHVTVTRDCTVNHHGQVVRLTEGQDVTGTFATFLATTGAPVEVHELDEPEPVNEPESDVEDQDQNDAAPEAPPKNGAGSGRDAWAAHAADLGIDVPDDWGRDDIIDAVESR